MINSDNQLYRNTNLDSALSTMPVLRGYGMRYQRIYLAQIIARLLFPVSSVRFERTLIT